VDAQMDMALDDIIAQGKRKKGPSDRDVDMKDSGGYGPRRRQSQRRDRTQHSNAPYSKQHSRYVTSGDVEQTWKHDLFGKDEDEVEETGWGTKKESNSELLSGTVVYITNLHYEVTEDELKVSQITMMSLHRPKHY
jgi:hypothetical protein